MISFESNHTESHALKCEMAADVLRSEGTLRLQVLGWSMFPAIRPGDIIVAEKTHPGQFENGDIVLFHRDRRLIAHRVIGIRKRLEDSELLTRGDAMPAADAPLTDHEILGRVSVILRDGQSLIPSRRLRFSERAVASFVRRSEVAARVVVGAHGLRQRAQIA